MTYEAPTTTSLRPRARQDDEEMARLRMAPLRTNDDLFLYVPDVDLVADNTKRISLDLLLWYRRRSHDDYKSLVCACSFRAKRVFCTCTRRIFRHA